jgi:hypothetical protein
MSYSVWVGGCQPFFIGQIEPGAENEAAPGGPCQTGKQVN